MHWACGLGNSMSSMIVGWLQKPYFNATFILFLYGIFTLLIEPSKHLFIVS